MSINAYYNGVFCNKVTISIPVTDRSVFFGDGIYDAAIGKGMRIFMLKEHIDRFFSNAKALDIPFDLSENDLIRILERLCSLANYKCFFLYFQLSRFSPERCHAYPKTKKYNLLITVSEIPEPASDRILSLSVEEDVRHTMCNIKTLNLLPAVIASHKAELQGKDEAVLHRGGIVTECAHSNIHIIKNGKLITHPLDNFILPGISRKHLLLVCERMGVCAEERVFDLRELFSADEILLTSSSKLALRVGNINEYEYRIYDGSLGDLLCKEMHNDFYRFCK